MASETNNGDTEAKKRDVWTSKEMEILLDHYIIKKVRNKLN
jgi:hypothetical protein